MPENFPLHWPLDDVRGDPAPVTPFDEVFCAGLLRLRHYPSTSRGSPVLLVYPPLKRPFLLDLHPDRSVVRGLLDHGLSVYVTDWMPPAPRDEWRGLDSYVEDDLVAAVTCIAQRERAERVSLIGCSLGSAFALMYAAAHPQSVMRLVTLALPVDACLPAAQPIVAYMTSLYHILPAWFVGAQLNRRVPHRSYVPWFLTEELGEPELLQPTPRSSSLVDAFEAWVRTDVPIAGQLAREVAAPLATIDPGALHVGNRQVDLERIECPVLNVAADRDRVAPEARSRVALERLTHATAEHLTLPGGHLGLYLAEAAHQRLWPRIAEWLRPPTAAEAPHPVPAQ
jgi:polyhydroxyalkanoate synthase